jgi:hypothetical protein
MELPDDILNIIKEYSKPITRPDWREGCYYNRHLDDVLECHFTLEEIVEIVVQVTRSKEFNYEYIMIYNEFLV